MKIDWCVWESCKGHVVITCALCSKTHGSKEVHTSSPNFVSEAIDSAKALGWTTRYLSPSSSAVWVCPSCK